MTLVMMTHHKHCHGYYYYYYYIQHGTRKIPSKTLGTAPRVFTAALPFPYFAEMAASIPDFLALYSPAPCTACRKSINQSTHLTDSDSDASRYRIRGALWQSMTFRDALGKPHKTFQLLVYLLLTSAASYRVLDYKCANSVSFCRHS